MALAMDLAESERFDDLQRSWWDTLDGHSGYIDLLLSIGKQLETVVELDMDDGWDSLEWEEVIVALGLLILKRLSDGDGPPAGASELQSLCRVAIMESRNRVVTTL